MLDWQILSFNDALAEITFACENLSWWVQCIVMSLDDVFHKWTAIASEEQKFDFSS
jgi:hypothetical protein